MTPAYPPGEVSFTVKSLSTAQAIAPMTTNYHQNDYYEAKRLYINEFFDVCWDRAKSNLGGINVPVYLQIRNCVLVVKAEGSWSTAEVG